VPGHNRCYALAPQIFDVDELGYSVVILEEIPARLQSLALKAVRNCPERAISVVEDERLEPAPGG
jgi:ferredoxin